MMKSTGGSERLLLCEVLVFKKALEEAMVLWIKQGTILIDIGEIDAIMEYLRKNPAKPFVYDPSRGITVEANKEWARKKLGISNS